MPSFEKKPLEEQGYEVVALCQGCTLYCEGFSAGISSPVVYWLSRFLALNDYKALQ